MPKLIIALDSQRLGALEDCLFRYDLRFNRNLDQGTTSLAIQKGSFMHELLRFYYLGRKGNEPVTEAEVYGPDGSDITIEFSEPLKPYDARDNAIPQARKKLVEISLSDEDAITEVLATFHEYVDYYSACTWKIIDVESPFSVVLFEDDVVRVVNNEEYSGLIILWEGIIDLEVMNAAGESFPVDHKTAGRRNYPEVLTNQFAGYAFKTDQKLVCVNQIEYKKGADKFHRPFLVYPNHIINRWCESVINTVVERYIPALNSGNYYRNIHACNTKFKCVFAEYCEADATSQKFLLNSKYTETKPWDPFNRDE